jgi:lipopolysaccharide/colanic/teichoic acid biosynthesis glycosyltransferase
MGKQDSFIKRFTDIVISLIVLIITSPIMMICIVAIRLETKGPAILVQERVGRGYKFFKFYKLRGMVMNAMEIGPDYTMIDDPRLTKTGKLFRRLSVDEIPQFFNVLKGDMSIIGPRPDLDSVCCKYTAEERKVFDFKPGITGISQVNGRQTLTPSERVRMEIDYYSKATFWSDLMIILKTPFVVITNEGNI